MAVYKITNIERYKGKKEDDLARLGKQITIHTLKKGHGAILPYADTSGYVLVTSVVQYIDKTDSGKMITISTMNTTYTLRKVADDLL
ncbi:hypothetical protein [Bacillus gaemokensis]|uniref:Uncharacterized protein n=1 Tax=Bacillus gaemokensis TaxID=574375 RepID=A0A073K7J2_9BACI|nr:hypothetical protein [Bacillus gaemokensis]KEK22496.1 hypothetical protein BAGA_19030 [Bacillus gaemokensis]KYG28808.1 hypothetical protein AZF08_13875 [Bacillus gaemokensis]